MLNSLLQMSGISKRFPGVRALENVNLDVYAGEIVALIGENGAGKSTLMNILGGVVQKDAGTILLNGEPIEIDSPRDASARRIEFIHQELSVLDNLDVAANIFLHREPIKGGWLKLINRGRMYQDANAIISKLGLALSSRTSLNSLSLAQQQLVEIARAISSGAQLIIMDEPTSSLTVTETARLLQIIKDLREQNVSIIYISHRLHEVQEIADRAVVLRDGQNAGELSRTEISHERMVRMMVGRDLKDFFTSGCHTRREPSDGDWFTFNNLRTSRYPGRHVSLSLRRGEILGLAGLVGAGRTEVARAIFGIDAGAQTEVVLGSRCLRIASPQDAVKHGIYLVPEDRRQCGLIVDFTVRENISLPGLNRWSISGLINASKETAVAQHACKSINIKTPSVETKAANLSGGNQQKVVLAKWLALAPKVLIFDEPTRGIDVGAKAEIYALIRQLADEGVSIIVISSEMEEVLGISDRIAVMHEGRITGVLEHKQFSEEAVMRLATGAARAA
ncbi:MAG TPA: sugar ABC transporter ATP-binding protein [Pyrinomonadaceae bacterium]|jgi:ribose transport system ATP-binding protein|nr:sugar ABC transporter ATP-binding protein [Pyrinomonadaceae bacterium]